MYDNVQKIKEKLLEWYGIMIGIGTDIVNGIKNGISDAWNGFITWIKETFNNIITTVKDLLGIHSPSTVFAEIGNYLIQGLINGVNDKIQSVKDTFSELWENIKNVFTPVSDWFRNTFSSAWDKVKDVFSTGGVIFDGITNGIATMFKDIVNSLIDGINRVISQPFENINSILDNLRSIELFGNQPFGGIPNVSIPQIPHLATGGLIPPRSEFMAILGDNTRENEIVSPISAMKQAVIEAISESGISSDRPINLYLDSEILFSTMRNKNQQYVKQTGKSAF